MSLEEFTAYMLMKHVSVNSKCAVVLMGKIIVMPMLGSTTGLITKYLRSINDFT